MSHLKLLKDVNQTKKLDLSNFIKEAFLTYRHCLGYSSQPGDEDNIFNNSSVSIPREIVDGRILIYQMKVDEIINSSVYK